MNLFSRRRLGRGGVYYEGAHQSVWTLTRGEAGMRRSKKMVIRRSMMSRETMVLMTMTKTMTMMRRIVTTKTKIEMMMTIITIMTMIVMMIWFVTIMIVIHNWN